MQYSKYYATKLKVVISRLSRQEWSPRFIQ